VTPSTSAECGIECAVGMQHVAMIRGSYVLWRECCACYQRKEAEAAADREQAKKTIEAKLGKGKAA
jgi:hypothetical protein